MNVRAALLGPLLFLHVHGCATPRLDLKKQAEADTHSPAFTTPAQTTAAATGVAGPQRPMPPAPDAKSQGTAQTPPKPPTTGASDECADRQVARTTPCHDDPDPCGLDSGYPGDEYCLLPPAPDEGIQIHLGPKDYTNRAEIAKYLIAPNAEGMSSAVGQLALADDRAFARIRVQMRPGVLQWNLWQVERPKEDGVFKDALCGGAQQTAGLTGGQNLIYDDPPLGVAAPENEGLGGPVFARGGVCAMVRTYNYETQAHLLDLWVNVYFMDKSKVATRKAGGVSIIGGLGLTLKPKQTIENAYRTTANGDGRIIQLAGSRFAHTKRLAAYLNDELVYDSWDWQAAATFNYDSITTNPPLDGAHERDGAYSGILEFHDGDELKVSCLIENDSDETLSFKNSVEGGETCQLTGRTVGEGSFESMLIP